MPTGQLPRGRLRTTYLILMAVSLVLFAVAGLTLYADQPMGVVSLSLGLGLGIGVGATVMRWGA